MSQAQFLQSSAVGAGLKGCEPNPQGSNGTATSSQWACSSTWVCAHHRELSGEVGKHTFPAESTPKTSIKGGSHQRSPKPLTGAPRGNLLFLCQDRRWGSADARLPLCPPPPGLTSSAQAACPASRATGPPSGCTLTDGLPQCPARLAKNRSRTNLLASGPWEPTSLGLNRTAGRALFIGAACPDVGLLAASQIVGGGGAARHLYRLYRSLPAEPTTTAGLECPVGLAQVTHTQTARERTGQGLGSPLGTHIQKGPQLALMLCGYHRESLDTF